MKFFIGIDVGASTTKSIIIDKKKQVLGHSVIDSGADFQGAAEQCVEQSLGQAEIEGLDDCYSVSTGYGRGNVRFSNKTRTEISCHAKGSFFHYPRAHTLIDIGGQDSKIVRIDGAGKRTGFKMNRKCAAGTGAFLEEISFRLKIPLGELNGLAESAEKEVHLGAYCTVFTATELLAKIREGVKAKDLVRGVFGSVLKRALEMDPLEGNIAMSGGVVAHNPFMVEMFSRKLKRDIFIPPLPQFTGAFGAALFALEKKGG
jgi:predicted CoA-substrate-specific enzyme activase